MTTAIVKVSALLPTPKGSTTVTCTVPTAVSRAPGTIAVSVVADTNVVATAVPLNCTVAPAMKLLPVTVSVNDCPTETRVGLREATISFEYRDRDREADMMLDTWLIRQ